MLMYAASWRFACGQEARSATALVEMDWAELAGEWLPVSEVPFSRLADTALQLGLQSMC